MDKDILESEAPAAEEVNDVREENAEISTEADTTADAGAAPAKEAEERFTPRDYEAMMRADLEELHGQFPHLRSLASIRELDDPLRYAALRDLGLSPREAYLATSKQGQVRDNRSHITSSYPKGAASSPDTLSGGELESARMIFSDLSDREIQKLYKKVTK